MKVLIEESTLTNIADAIRIKTETNDTMYPKEMAGKVLNISTGIDTSDATAEAVDILNGETAYVNGVKVTGAIPVKEAEEYTPSTEDQVINSGLYLNGNQTIKGDTNLLAENIKSGVTIFGVEGNMQEGVDTSDGTATADDIMLNKTAYVNDEKIIGNFTLDSELATQDELISQILIGLEGKTAGGGIDTSDADAIESDLMLGKTAYVNNTKLTGTFTIDDELTEQSNVISEIKSELANVNVGTAQGHYIWEKVTDTNDVLYVTSSDENKYPDGGTLDGYYYERVNLEERLELPDTITAGETIVDAKLHSEFVASATTKEVIATTIRKSGTYKFTICTEYGCVNGTIYLRKNGTNVLEFPNITTSDYDYYEGWSSVELTCSEGDRISVLVVTRDNSGSYTYSVQMYAFITSIAMDFNEFTYPSLISLLNSSKVSATYSNNKIKASGIYVDIPKDGTYAVSYSATRSDGTDSSFKSQIYKNGTALDNTGVTWGTTVRDRNTGSYSGNIVCAKGDQLVVYGYAPYNSEESSYITIGTLRAEYVLS